MLKNILKLEGAEIISKKKQLSINGGGTFPTNEEDCLNCGGFWYAPLCELSVNSPCLQH